MSEFESVLDYQVRSMLEAIEADSARRHETVLAEARSEARALLKRVRRESLARLRAAVEEERGLYEERIQQARAALATRRRQQRQKRERVALQAARTLLREALERRWRDQACRREWVEAAVNEAAAVLEHGEWTVRHAEGLTPDEAQRLAGLVRGFTDKFELLADDELTCGLAVESRGAVVDMSVDGLLGRTEEIDGRLLAALYREAGAEEQTGESGNGASGATGPRRAGEAGSGRSNGDRSNVGAQVHAEARPRQPGGPPADPEQPPAAARASGRGAGPGTRRGPRAQPAVMENPHG